MLYGRWCVCLSRIISEDNNKMPRKKKKTEEEPKATYHKSKNGRYYKKMTVNGKCKCRFVSKAEGEAGFTDSSSVVSKKKKMKRKKKDESATEEAVE